MTVSLDCQLIDKALERPDVGIRIFILLPPVLPQKKFQLGLGARIFFNPLK